MQVFKCAMKLVMRRPVYFLVYGVWLSLMAVFMASSLMSPASTDEYEKYQVDYAVIDRDSSQVSEGVCEFLTTQGDRIAIEDSDFAIQDAVAKDTCSYLLIIPDGYGEAFMEAAKNAEPLPEMECIYSYYSAEGALVDAALAEYLSSLSAYAAAMPDKPVNELIELAMQASRVYADVQIIPSETDTTETDKFMFYLQFDMYVYFAGIIVCVGMMLVTLNRAEVRRRNLASPISYIRYSAQTMLACLVVMMIFWALTYILGAVCFPQSFAAVPPLGKVMMAIVPFVFALIPLSVAFLMGQLHVGETLMNAVGNILGLVLSFLGGSWVPMDIMTPEVNMIAHFLPGYWYTDALSRACQLGSSDYATLAAIGCDIGIMLLFAAAVFGIALVVGRMRTQTSEAGGNAAAEVVAI
ncbi:ABC transporter permease [Adlercreutzia sp. ZJ154]|uniref:ABC transporter permease n=1 Tax=Adlercreutzia sp. ZJ154 TaxID=2709790 RepID=UPI0013ECE869|nr:ABC transporter permease [Adlercreutzia sp. ZJ154]